MGNLNSLRAGEDQDNEHRVTVMNYHNGDRYEGEIFRNLRDGQGSYICGDKEKRSNYEYSGGWKNNLRDGHGKCFFYNGDLYVGEWKQGKRHGKGDHFYRKGDRYSGEWKNDMKDGDGTLISQNGQKFKGKYKQDKKHGIGEMILPDGQVFEETWQFGILQYHRKIDKPSDDSATKQISSRMQQIANISNRSINGKTDKRSSTRNQNTSNISAVVDLATQKVDIATNVCQLLVKKPDVLQWNPDDVANWLQATTLEQFQGVFKRLNVDGYTLIQLKEHDLDVHFKIESLGQRKHIIKNIYTLKGLWVKLTGESAHGLNISESPSVLLDSYDRSLDQSSTSVFRSHTFADAVRKSEKESPTKPLIPGRRKQAKQFAELSMLSGGAAPVVNRFNNSNNNISGFSNDNSIGGAGSILKPQISPMNEKEYDAEDNDRCDEDDDKQIDGEEYYLEQTGLIKSFKSSGFNFFIEFSELQFDQKNDYVGGGGYGDVYVGKWLGTKVAVKKFGKRYLTRKAVKDFIKEIEVVNQLRHPNIVLYMGVSLDSNNFYYMVTEFVQKGSLFEILHQKKILLDDFRIIRIAKQIAMSLQYLHKKKILHCDLKSQNILLNDDWTVKICDFGLARYKEKFQKENHGKIGTPHWMAPEILRGEKYEEAADIYSFGVILWEMLTGEIPYMGRSIAQITGIVGYHKEKLGFREKHNKNLMKIVNNCLLFEPQRRPTFDHIINYIERIEQRPKYETTTPIVMKLSEFLS